MHETTEGVAFAEEGRLGRLENSRQGRRAAQARTLIREHRDRLTPRWCQRQQHSTQQRHEKTLRPPGDVLDSHVPANAEISAVCLG